MHLLGLALRKNGLVMNARFLLVSSSSSSPSAGVAEITSIIRRTVYLGKMYLPTRSEERLLRRLVRLIQPSTVEFAWVKKGHQARNWHLGYPNSEATWEEDLDLLGGMLAGDWEWQYKLPICPEYVCCRTPFNAEQGQRFPDGPFLSGRDCSIFVGIAPTLRGEPKFLSGRQVQVFSCLTLPCFEKLKKFVGIGEKDPLLLQGVLLLCWQREFVGKI